MWLKKDNSLFLILQVGVRVLVGGFLMCVHDVSFCGCPMGRPRGYKTFFMLNSAEHDFFCS